jgi:hypothetical protein
VSDIARPDGDGRDPWQDRVDSADWNAIATEVRSARGWSAAPPRHGVSVIRSGQRYTLGLVFHDAS